MVYRVYVEKRAELASEAAALAADIRGFLRIKGLAALRLLNRYDVEGISRELFESSLDTVFSEPQTDVIYDELPEHDGVVFATEYLPGQFDQRADSAAQCIQIISCGERPAVRTARVYLLSGELSADDVEAIKKYVINPVESREASLKAAATLADKFDIPKSVAVLDGFCAIEEAELSDYIKRYGLAMDADDLRFCRDYFRGERRDPTITELRMIDTYWSDHCRHTTFQTRIENAEFADPLLRGAFDRYMDTRRALGTKKPVTLMDLATIAAKKLKKDGKLSKLDESEEINACTVKITVNVDGVPEDWLLLFKNETHNHPTEIEPFGGAATCIGGAIRDPLSGRAYVYSAMRVTGAADPRRPVEETLPGKLPQKKLVTTAAAGYSSYGNQVGLATGIVDELYHDGYAAKRLEIGAVIGAAPARNVRRERPEPGDVVILLGGHTGRDGCGGATGSSKSHTLESLDECGAEVQKGNAPEERKLQRLFRNAEASLLVKRCNDFGAGGVSVAIGELADGLRIDLGAVPKKYEGLDGTELAISESQERMAVVVSPEDAPRFMEIAASENLEATRVAVVTEEARLVMDWNGAQIVNVSREFLDSNGAEKHIDIAPESPHGFEKAVPSSFAQAYHALAGDLNVCSKRGLAERFDSTIGRGGVLMPFGGEYQQTPVQAMVNKISVEKGETDDCSFMAWGYNPYISEKSPYHGAYLAVVESVSKLIATGADFRDVYLTLQEFFEKPGSDPRRWGQPLAALLGAFAAQTDLGVGAIGGKDSMSGSFEKLDVPPTLVSFAVTTGKVSDVISPEFKAAGHRVVLLTPEYTDDKLPSAASLVELFGTVTSLIRSGAAISAWTPTYGGVAEGILKMCLGNEIGFEYADVSLRDIFAYSYGSFILELADNAVIDGARELGVTTDMRVVRRSGESLSLEHLRVKYEGVLEQVFPCNIETVTAATRKYHYSAASRRNTSTHIARPRVLIPVFPGTNCEYDSAAAVRAAGAEPEILVVRNLTASAVRESVERFAQRIAQSQIVFIPGGFSGGDEPDGSGKFITAFFRSAAIRDGVSDLLENRDGLMCGICNGFQALIKLGLVPFGKIIDADPSCPTLTFNTIGRHQSRLVRTRVASNMSPWLMDTEPGEVYTVPISHGEGRFVCSDELLREMAANGQIATQYVDKDGEPTYDIHFNPNGSTMAVEGITSPDGRVFGKMGHSERIGEGLYKNVPGRYDMGIFRSAVRYFA